MALLEILQEREVRLSQIAQGVQIAAVDNRHAVQRLHLHGKNSPAKVSRMLQNLLVVEILKNLNNFLLKTSLETRSGPE
jgi:hypothetical protein